MQGDQIGAPEALLSSLAEFVVGAPLTDTAVRDKAHLHLLDGIAVACATVHAKDGLAAALKASTTAAGDAVMIGMGPASELDAAFINAALIHGRDFDDAFYERVVHAEAPVVAALIAAASTARATSRDLVTALAIGMEVSIRFALACRHQNDLFSSGFHNTAVFGAFGAAAAVSRLLGSDAQQTADALALCAGFAAGTAGGWNAPRSRVKPLQVGNAARVGLHAVKLARAGLGGAAQSLFGDDGFMASHTAAHGWDDTPLVKQLGQYWHFMEAGFKLFPAGAMVQASIECALDVRAQLATASAPLDAIESIALTVPNQYELVLQRQTARGSGLHVQAAYEAFSNWALNVALALTDGTVEIDNLNLDRLRDPDLIDVAKRVVVRADQQHLEASLEDRPTLMTCNLVDGRTFNARRDGHGGMPSRSPGAAVREKFLAYVGRVLGVEQATSILPQLDEAADGPLPDLSAPTLASRHQEKTE